MNIELNRALFYKICYDSTLDEHKRFNIGTYNEKKLHIILKRYFEPNSDYHEIPYKGFIADVKKDSCITEIETSGFSGLNDKLAAFLPDCCVNLVYPIPYIRYLSWINPETGDISKKRRSPKKRTVYDALFEMIRIKKYLRSPNLTVTAVLLNVDEYRMLNGWSRDKKKGSNRYERIPTDLCGIVQFKTDADYAEYIPDKCSKSENGFTLSEFSKAAGINSYTAQAVIKVFEERGIVLKIGKRRNAYLYAVSEPYAV